MLNAIELENTEFLGKLQTFQKIFLPELERFFLEWKADTALQGAIFQEMIGKLFEFTMRGGKRIRPALLYYGYRGFTEDNEIAIWPIAVACELMQSFFLIHDDIMDEAEIRRGGKSMHHSFCHLFDDPRYTQSMAILVGNIAGYLGIKAINTAGIAHEHKCQITALYAQTCVDVGFGQALDILPNFKTTLLEKAIYDIYYLKTGCYTVEFPLLCAAILAKKGGDSYAQIKAIGKCIGSLFQIQDDISGLFGDSQMMGKSILSDVQQGKKTLLIYKALENATAKQRVFLNRIYGNCQAIREEILQVKEIVTQTGALAYAENEMQSQARKAHSLLEKLGLREESELFFKQLIDHWTPKTKKRDSHEPI